MGNSAPDTSRYNIYQAVALNWFIRQVYMKRPASYRKGRKAERQNRKNGRLLNARH